MELLTPGTGLIIWQTLIFLGLFFVLTKFAWKPIVSSLKEREQSIQGALDEAERARKEMSQMKSENEALLKAARDERDKILREARDIANKLNEEAQGEAKKSADKIIQDAKAAIEIEKQAALRDVREQVAIFSLEIAERLMKRNLSSDASQKELVDDFLKDLKLN